jgi:hypothetical protein
LPKVVADMSQKTIDYEAGKIKLNWTVPSNFSTVGADVLYYTIYRDVGSGVFYNLSTSKTNEFTDTGLVHGQKYNYKVSATNIIG